MQVSVSIIRDIIYRAVHRGAALTEVCQAVSIRPEELRDGEKVYDLEKVSAVWKAAVHHSGDPLLGLHTGAEVNFEAIGVVGFVMQNSPDVRTALDRGAHYANVYSNLLEITFERKESDAVALFVPVSPFVQGHPGAARQAVESSMAFVVRVVRKLSGQRIVPKAVLFAFPPPPGGALPEYQAIFDSRLAFRESHNALVFSARDLEAPVVSYNAALFGLLDAEASRLLQAYHHGASFQERVKRALVALLKRKYPSLEEVGAELKVSTRTLQRKLKEEGTTYQETVEAVQKELALAYLRDDHLTFSEIAYLLGYSELSVFTRAFKRWTGSNPSEYRNT
ncbi:MAG: AraC family transcriptional regulator [Ferruginibacter sp.]|nr:AraC family transcriptional regulator [Cytophagales bacterium]